MGSMTSRGKSARGGPSPPSSSSSSQETGANAGRRSRAAGREQQRRRTSGRGSASSPESLSSTGVGGGVASPELQQQEFAVAAAAGLLPPGAVVGGPAVAAAAGFPPAGSAARSWAELRDRQRLQRLGYLRGAAPASGGGDERSLVLSEGDARQQAAAQHQAVRACEVEQAQAVLLQQAHRRQQIQAAAAVEQISIQQRQLALAAQVPAIRLATGAPTAAAAAVAAARYGYIDPLHGSATLQARTAIAMGRMPYAAGAASALDRVSRGIAGGVTGPPFARQGQQHQGHANMDEVDIISIESSSDEEDKQTKDSKEGGDREIGLVSSRDRVKKMGKHVVVDEYEPKEAPGGVLRKKILVAKPDSKAEEAGDDEEKRKRGGASKRDKHDRSEFKEIAVGNEKRKDAESKPSKFRKSTKKGTPSVKETANIDTETPFDSFKTQPQTSADTLSDDSAGRKRKRINQTENPAGQTLLAPSSHKRADKEKEGVSHGGALNGLPTVSCGAEERAASSLSGLSKPASPLDSQAESRAPSASPENFDKVRDTLKKNIIGTTAEAYGVIEAAGSAASTTGPTCVHDEFNLGDPMFSAAIAAASAGEGDGVGINKTESHLPHPNMSLAGPFVKGVLSVDARMMQLKDDGRDVAVHRVTTSIASLIDEDAAKDAPKGKIRRNSTFSRIHAESIAGELVTNQRSAVKHAVYLALGEMTKKHECILADYQERLESTCLEMEQKVKQEQETSKCAIAKAKEKHNVDVGELEKEHEEFVAKLLVSHRKEVEALKKETERVKENHARALNSCLEASRHALRILQKNIIAPKGTIEKFTN